VGRPECLPPCKSNYGPKNSIESKREKRVERKKRKIGKVRKKEMKKRRET